MMLFRRVLYVVTWGGDGMDSLLECSVPEACGLLLLLPIVVGA
jgi:hypothetical protein